MSPVTLEDITQLEDILPADRFVVTFKLKDGPIDITADDLKRLTITNVMVERPSKYIVDNKITYGPLKLEFVEVEGRLNEETLTKLFYSNAIDTITLEILKAKGTIVDTSFFTKEVKIEEIKPGRLDSSKAEAQRVIAVISFKSLKQEE